MEFECQEDIIQVSNNLVNCVDNNSEIDSLHFLKLRLDSLPEKGVSPDDDDDDDDIEPFPVAHVLSNYRRCITDLPAALISEILNCLAPKELGIVSCVSNILYRVASEHQVWKEFYSERWELPAPLSSGIPDDKSWKDLFVERDFRSKTFLGRYNLDVLHGHTEPGNPHLFDLKGTDTEFRLWEHDGPITSLSLDLNRIYSGSWDMTVHVLDRTTFKCLQILRHSDWVYGLIPHDITIVSSSGSNVYVWDINTGTLMNIIHDAHVGNIYALARSHGGDFIFTGGEDGEIHMYEISEDGVMLIAKWAPHSGPVNSLAFEFPWLVSASNDGKLALMDVRKLIRASRRALRKRVSSVDHRNRNSAEPPQRMLHGYESMNGFLDGLVAVANPLLLSFSCMGKSIISRLNFYAVALVLTIQFSRLTREDVKDAPSSESNTRCYLIISKHSSSDKSLTDVT
ncbi:hypothetical protein ACFE04_015368 [Oxalis oulophora]